MRTFWLWLTGRLVRRNAYGKAFLHGPLWVIPLEETTGQDDPTLRSDWADIKPCCEKEKRDEPQR